MLLFTKLIIERKKLYFKRKKCCGFCKLKINTKKVKIYFVINCKTNTVKSHHKFTLSLKLVKK